MLDLLHQLLDFIRDPGPMLGTIGIWGMALVVFIETGLLFPFLPGDSMLVVAGIYAARGTFPPALLIGVLVPAAIVGSFVGYFIGHGMGPRLFNRPRSRIFRPEYAEAAQRYFDRHGGAAILIARFMPIVRTYVPVIAGVAKMPLRRFALWNVLGAVAWIVSLVFLGYFMGEASAASGFPLDKHLEKVIIVIVFLSLLPGIIGWWRGRKAVKAASVTPPNP